MQKRPPEPAKRDHLAAGTCGFCGIATERSFCSAECLTRWREQMFSLCSCTVCVGIVAEAIEHYATEREPPDDWDAPTKETER